jgi:predicted nucleic acid-binding Zn ribbon protein
MTDQHKHCPMCQKPVPLSEKFCSPKCEQIYRENQNKVAKTRKMLYILFAAFILIWIFFTIRGKFGL